MNEKSPLEITDKIFYEDNDFDLTKVQSLLSDTLQSSDDGAQQDDEPRGFAQWDACAAKVREGCRPRYSSLTFTQQTTHRSPSSSPHASCSLTSSLTSFSSTPLREYFQQTVHVRLTVKRSELLESMSPTLKAEVAWECNKEWLSRIWFLKGASQAFLVQLSLRLTAQVFAPGEIAPQGYMYIVHRGVALYGGKVFGAGESPWVRVACWGAWLLMPRRAVFVHSPSSSLVVSSCY